MTIRIKLVQRWVATPFQFFCTKPYGNISTGRPHRMQVEYEKYIFDQ